MLKTTAIAAAAILVAVGAGDAHAQRRLQVRSIAVSYADLDLDSAEGRATLDNRIRSAVRRVCSPVVAYRDGPFYREWRNCLDEASAGAQRQVAELYANRRLVSNTLAIATPER